MTARRPGVRLPRRRCECGAVKLIAIAPGTDDIRSDVGDILLQRATTDSHWCVRCWQRRYSRQQQTTQEAPNV